MSKARAQSSKRKMLRTLYGSQSSSSNSSKRTGMRLQVINEFPPKKIGKKSDKDIKRDKWLKRLPFHLGSTKFIYHQQIIKPVEIDEEIEKQEKETTEDISETIKKI